MFFRAIANTCWVAGSSRSMLYHLFAKPRVDAKIFVGNINGLGLRCLTQAASDHKWYKQANRSRKRASFGLMGLSGLCFLLWLNTRDPSSKSFWENIPSMERTLTVSAATPFSGGKDRPPGGVMDPPDIPDKKSNLFNFNFIADVVEKVAPAVVYIEINDLRRRDLMTGKHLAISNGSGFFVSPDGLILTNAHVVENRPRMSNITVKLSDGSSYHATVEDLDIDSDLATLRIPVKGVPTLPLGDSAKLRPGEWVVAMGSPLSLANTITVGVVSSKGRGSAELGLRTKDIDYIQTDAAITFGNSGGPLINLDGEAIGINSMKVTAGISFAIPSDHAKTFLAETSERNKSWAGSKWARSKESKGAPRRRYMGITMLTLNPQLIHELRQRMHPIPSDIDHGVLVWKLVVGSPAFKGGLQPGDILIEINGKAIHSAHDVYRAVEKDALLKLLVVRNEKQMHVTITPEE